MITIYIKKLDKKDIDFTGKPKKIIEKFKMVFINKINIIKVKQIDQNKKIYLLPNINKTSIYKRVIKKLEKEKTKTEKVQIVLSNDIKKYQNYFDGPKIVNSDQIYFNSIEEILKNILQDNLLEMQDIYVLTNYYKEKNINLIRNLTPKVKTMNVVTNQIQQYNNLESMLEEWGMPIVISNNKRKSLKNAKFIINLDFSKEELSKYIICRNAVIINFTKEKLDNLKGFGGITIQDVRNKIK